MALPDHYRGQTVSQGTLRPADLIPKFLAVLEEDDFGATESLAMTYDLDADPAEMDDEEAGELVDALIEALNESAPEGTYFGTHEGDGALFGFWSIEADNHELEGDASA